MQVFPRFLRLIQIFIGFPKNGWIVRASVKNGVKFQSYKNRAFLLSVPPLFGKGGFRYACNIAELIGAVSSKNGRKFGIAAQNYDVYSPPLTGWRLKRSFPPLPFQDRRAMDCVS